MAGGVGHVARDVVKTTGAVVGEGISAVTSSAASAAKGIGTLTSAGIAAAQSAFEDAAATARQGLEQGIKSGIGGLGMLPPPGMFISQMAKAEGPMGEILKQLQNPSLNVQKEAADAGKTFQSAGEIAANRATQEMQKFAEEMNRFQNAVSDFAKKQHDLSKELIRHLKA